MKISKNKGEGAKSQSIVQSSGGNCYDDAITYIKSAMNALNACAKNGDQVAKDSIVNMGVVAFDLQSNKKS